MTINYIFENLLLQQKIVITLLLLSLAVGVFRYRKLYNPDRIFLIILIISLCAELGSIYLGFFTKIDNYFCFNLLSIFSFPLFLVYYKKLGISFPFYVLLLLFLLGVLYSLIFESFNGGLYFISPLFGAFTIVISIFYYFAHILNNRQLENLSKKSSFLFSCGLMIFYIAIIPFFLLNKYLELTNITYQIIFITLNVILYTFYILAFLCSHRKTY